MPRTNRLLIYALFLISGGTALIYQVAWSRDLALILGASHQAISIVLASFMGGLALGGMCFGRIAGRVKRPLRTYGLLELGVACSAAVLPVLLRAVDQLYVSLAMRAGDSVVSLVILRLVMAFVILVLPTFFMGGTLPLLAQVIVRSTSDFGQRLSWLYGINTLGAVVGAVVAGFVLMPRFGVWHTQVIAIGLTVGVGSLAVLVDVATRRSMDDAVAGGERLPHDADAASASTADTTIQPNRGALYLAFLGTAVSGCCALALEVMWTRAISIATGTTIYSFTMMLAAFLLGIALGSALHAIQPLKRVNVAVQFGVALGLIGLSSLVVTYLIPRLPEIGLLLDRQFYGGLNGARPITTLVLSFLVMLVPCTFMGMAFPLAGQARAALIRGIGRPVGDVVAYNTVGAIVGSLLAGFILIPFVGLQRGLIIVSAANLGYGLIVVWTAFGAVSSSRRPVTTIGVLASLALMIALPLLLPNWNAALLTRFQNNNPAAFTDPSGKIDVNKRLAEMTPLYYREGPCSSVAVLEMDGLRSLVLNGRCVATEVESDLHHEMMLGHLPVLLHPHPKSAIVIGLGASITLGGVSAHPELEHITVVEIEPAVYGGAEYFSHVTGNTLRDPRLKKVVQDGRNYLLTTPEKFDVITADPIHPWSQGSTYLYTTEYCALAASRLAPGGIMCLWLPLYELSPDHLKSVVASFAENFKHTSIWQASADIVLIGSQEPLKVDLDDWSRRLNEPTVKRQLEPLGVDDPLSLLAECMMDGAAVKRFSEGAIINTDDNLYLEFASPLTIGHPLVKPNAELIMSHHVNPAWLLGDHPSEGTSRATETLATYQQAKIDTVRVSVRWLGAGYNPPDSLVAEIVNTLRNALAHAPDYGRAKVLLAEALAVEGSRASAAGTIDKAIASFNEALALNPYQSDANRMLGVAMCDQRRFADSLPHFEAALSRHPDDAGTRFNYGVALFSLKRLEDARLQFEQSLASRPNNANAHRQLGMTLLNQARPASAVAHFREAARLKPDDPQLKDTLGLALYMTGKKAEAIDELRRAVAQHPGDARLHLSLAWFLATCDDPKLRNGAEAERLARAAMKLMSADDPLALDALAASLAEQGRFNEALAIANQASKVATQQGKTGQVAQIAKRIAAYQDRKAYHE